MVFQFFKNHSDNRYVNKDLTPLSVGSTQEKIIDANIIPRVSAAESYITCSSQNPDYPAWGAFNSTLNTNFSNPDVNTCWLPTTEDDSPYIQYEFTEATVLTDITLTCFSNYGDVFTCGIVISASRDGVNFDDLYTGTITGNLQQATNVTYNLNNDTEYNYYRLSFDALLSVAYAPSLFIYNINANSYHYEEVPSYNMNVIYKENENKDTPNLELAYNSDLYEHANYAYCLDTGYYFYLTEPVCANHRLFFNAEVDLLMTYKDDIKKLGAIIARQENSFNTYIEDDRVAVFANRKVNAIKFPSGFSNTDNYILATNGLS